jgi:UDP-N-acetylmuramyl pentapeptide phosphotransferase/UDP-N-acetylglucosamine-1-phosphate transferase
MPVSSTVSWVIWGSAILAAAALASALLIVVLRPLLKSYAMAKPNARSSHKLPTPQGGGVAVIAATILIPYAAFYFLPAVAAPALRLPIVAAAVVLIAGVGVLADLHPKNVTSRLLLQAIAVATVIFVLPPGLRIVPIVPLTVERIALMIGGLWFVNLVNFMDGLDLMTVAEAVPITAALAVISFLGLLPVPATVISLALCGAMIGFAYFNRPAATLFLGDVGSMPIGLIVGWLLVLLAGNGGRTAAILLPLYYLADSTITLFRRVINGEQVWQAHRSHFYQRATANGFSVIEVSGRVFAVNLALGTLAFASVMINTPLGDAATLLAGAGLVGWLLVSFARGPK